MSFWSGVLLGILSLAAERAVESWAPVPLRWRQIYYGAIVVCILLYGVLFEGWRPMLDAFLGLGLIGLIVFSFLHIKPAGPPVEEYHRPARRGST